MAKQTYTTGQVLTAAQMTTLQANDYNWTVSAKTGNYTLVAADAGTRITMNSASATAITVNTSVFTAGDTLYITNIGTGACTVTAGTATVSSSGSLVLAQYDSGILYFSATGVAIWNGANPGDITGVTAGTGLTGGGSSGAVTLNLATTAKGDLVAGTGASTATALTVGNNGETLVADSSTSTGLRYQGLQAAGKNKFINGDTVVDQRNSGATSTASGTYTVDRFEFNASQATKFTWGQNYGGVTPPAGFSKYLGFKTTTAVTIAAGDYFFFGQKIEGQSIADLAWGTASAKTITLSFYVYSSLTGTFGGSIENSASNRSYPFTYTISAASTWERKTITIAGDTTGTWLTTSGIGAKVWLGLGVGSTYSGTAGAWVAADTFSATGATSVVGTLNATFYVTGFQFEQSSVATPFTTATGTIQGELAACQRYYYRNTAGTAYASMCAWTPAYTTSAIVAQLQFPVQMRVTPTVLEYGNLQFTDGNNNVAAGVALSLDSQCSKYIGGVYTGAAAGAFTVYRNYQLIANNNSAAYLAFSAEL